MSTRTPTRTRSNAVPRRPEPRSDGFTVVGSDRGLGFNLPQRMGRTLWLPMLAMSLMAFGAALVLGFARADVLATDPDDAVRLLQLQHVIAAVMFVGFTTVLSAITFAIARILGVFRDGGGRLQQTTVGHVQTLKMPVSAKLMIALMMMGMMAVLGAVVGHVVFAVGTTGTADLVRSEEGFVVLETIRRLGVSVHLVAIALGLATIVEVLRFQTVRIRELALAKPSSR